MFSYQQSDYVFTKYKQLHHWKSHRAAPCRGITVDKSLPESAWALLCQPSWKSCGSTPTAVPPTPTPVFFLFFLQGWRGGW